MIFVIAPLGERGSHRQHRVRVGFYCLGLLLAGSAVGAGLGALGGLARANGLIAPAWLWASVLGILVLRELGMIPVPLPYRDWQMPRSWLRHGNLRSAMMFGLTMGVGAVTRAPIAAFHATLLLDIMLASLGTGLIMGCIFAVGRALPVLIAAAMSRRSSTELLGVSNYFLNGMQFWRLLSTMVLSGVMGLVIVVGVTSAR